ncbi:methylenetetrahydrofolate reductase [Lactococcus nasutitermitis]|uniref:Methylenetetrahydrofolate reductase n=1 Tax=Lactococcus nasutitermitis TaxID=1652957 RepID=A0ABV9JA23_9LACT|nr:methylenetetrahydrofolate reductase [Lactococcus nasutitermitis]
MKISDIYKEKNRQNKSVVSLEVFPPQTSQGEKTIFNTVSGLTKKPDYISVTYRGNSGNKTLEIAKKIKEDTGIEVLHHLTAVQNSHQDMAKILKNIEQAGLENILALRGDLPKDFDANIKGEYLLARDLITDIKQRECFSVGAATYPEGHVSSPLDIENIEHLRQKYDAGADFFVSQLFFENERFYRLNEAIKTARITAPVTAGIMPIMSTANVERLIFFGASIPTKLIKIINKYKDNPEDLRKAGLEYSLEQIDDLLAHGVDGVHIYTMNRPSVANVIMERYL